MAITEKHINTTTDRVERSVDHRLGGDAPKRPRHSTKRDVVAVAVAGGVVLAVAGLAVSLTSDGDPPRQEASLSAQTLIEQSIADALAEVRGGGTQVVPSGSPFDAAPSVATGRTPQVAGPNADLAPIEYPTAVVESAGVSAQTLIEQSIADALAEVRGGRTPQVAGPNADLAPIEYPTAVAESAGVSAQTLIEQSIADALAEVRGGRTPQVAGPNADLAPIEYPTAVAESAGVSAQTLIEQSIADALAEVRGGRTQVVPSGSPFDAAPSVATGRTPQVAGPNADLAPIEYPTAVAESAGVSAQTLIEQSIADALAEVRGGGTQVVPSGSPAETTPGAPGGWPWTVPQVTGVAETTPGAPGGWPWTVPQVTGVAETTPGAPGGWPWTVPQADADIGRDTPGAPGGWPWTFESTGSAGTQVAPSPDDIGR